MSPGAEMIDEGLRSEEEVQGWPTVVYRGRHWPCTVSLLNRGAELEVGGRMEQLQMSITVRKSAIPVRTADQNEGETADSESETADSDVMPPHPKHLVIVNQRQYRILTVEETEAAWKVNLGSPNR